jgi:RNA 3'-terminal phosphate cyclase
LQCLQVHAALEEVLKEFCHAVQPLSITLTGITNDGTDPGIDIWRTVTFPLLRLVEALPCRQPPHQ